MSFQFQYAKHMEKIPSNPIFNLLPKIKEPGFISFAAGIPSADGFPYQAIAEITNTLLTTNAADLLQYGTTEGYAPLRKAMSNYIARSGLTPTPGEILITTGGQQVIDIICKLFIEPGDVVLVEAPTYSATLQILKSYRAKPISLAADDDGILPEDLEAKIKQYHPKFVYLIPTFQNPSGKTLSEKRREAVAEITGRLQTMLLEDDPYRDLRYKGEPIPTLKSFDRTGNILYMTSTSKILCPGFRVGALYAPQALMPNITVAKQAADMHSATLPQAIVCAYLESGLLDAHLVKLRDMYRLRLTAIQDAVQQFFPKSFVFTNPDGGLFIWCACPKEYNTLELLPIAVDRKVAFIPGDQFFAEDGILNTMRLNFSNESVESIYKGIEILGKLLHEHTN